VERRRKTKGEIEEVSVELHRSIIHAAKALSPHLDDSGTPCYLPHSGTLRHGGEWTRSARGICQQTDGQLMGDVVIVCASGSKDRQML